MVFSQKGIPRLTLTEEETRWLHVIDRLELWCWCKDQMGMGNIRVGLMQSAAADWLRKQEWTPGVVLEFMSSFSHYRTPEA
jgi:hypothetical protein